MLLIEKMYRRNGRVLALNTTRSFLIGVFDSSAQLIQRRCPRQPRETACRSPNFCTEVFNFHDERRKKSRKEREREAFFLGAGVAEVAGVTGRESGE